MRVQHVTQADVRIWAGTSQEIYPNRLQFYADIRFVFLLTQSWHPADRLSVFPLIFNNEAEKLGSFWEGVREEKLSGWISPVSQINLTARFPNFPNPRSFIWGLFLWEEEAVAHFLSIKCYCETSAGKMSSPWNGAEKEIALQFRVMQETTTASKGDAKLKFASDFSQ